MAVTFFADALYPSHSVFADAAGRVPGTGAQTGTCGDGVEMGEGAMLAYVREREEAGKEAAQGRHGTRDNMNESYQQHTVTCSCAAPFEISKLMSTTRNDFKIGVQNTSL